MAEDNPLDGISAFERKLHRKICARVFIVSACAYVFLLLIGWIDDDCLSTINVTTVCLLLPYFTFVCCFAGFYEDLIEDQEKEIWTPRRINCTMFTSAAFISIYLIGISGSSFRIKLDE
ncbi:hypothetical protein PFISCL1PPCAC_26180, partial [Pristionchus fissidentatus]